MMPAVHASEAFFLCIFGGRKSGGEMWASAMLGGCTDMKPSHLSERPRIRTGAGAMGRETENNAETSLDSGRGALANQVSAAWGGAHAFCLAFLAPKPAMLKEEKAQTT